MIKIQRLLDYRYTYQNSLIPIFYKLPCVQNKSDKNFILLIIYLVTGFYGDVKSLRS